MKLWKFECDCGNAGTIDGMFFATNKDIKAALGADIHIWDAFGIHSEVTLDLGRGHLSAIKIDAKTVAKLQEAVGGNDTLCGHNPLHYLPEEEED